MKYTFYFFVFTICILSCRSYDLNQLRDTAALAQEVKKSPIVVRIPTQGKKIAYLKAKLATGILNDKVRKEYKEELAVTVTEDNAYVAILDSAFHHLFTFSKQVYFVPDSLYMAFKNGSKKVFWEQGRIIEKPEFDHSKYFQILGGSNNKEQLHLVDQYGARLPKPLPYRKQINNYVRLFKRNEYIEKQIQFYNFQLTRYAL
jgi:hypothetical protein